MEQEANKRRIMISVAYDGSNYSGWQFQPGKRTIEGELNRCLSEIFKENIMVIGASRTDAGVHSLGSIAVFDTQARIPAEKVPYALNQKLPEDIRVNMGTDVDKDFHPRKCESRKTYEYHIISAPFQIPTESRYSWWTHRKLDVASMDEAAKYLVGEHDYTSFCSVYSQSDSKVRTIFEANVSSQIKTAGPLEYEEIIIRVTGSGFLYNMVRIIAGTLVDVGQGKLASSDIKKILEAQKREDAGPTAPACGLFLSNYSFI